MWIALVFALFLSACNDNGDDNKRADSDKTYLYESNYAKDSIDNASSIKVMTYKPTVDNTKISL